MDNHDRELVSIVVPVYNVAFYLPQCLDSLCAQTYKKIEVILVDDGSSDGSAEICDRYAGADSRIRVIHKENEGVSAARNDGMDRAKGRYLIFADADDYIRAELVETYLQAAEPGMTVVCEMTTDEQEWKSFDPSDWRRRTEYLKEERFMYAYDSDHINSPVNKLYDLAVIREHGVCFPEDMSLGEDLLFNLFYQEAFRGGWKLLKYPFYYYRENRSGSLSSSYRNDLFEIQQKTAEALYQFMQRTGLWNAESQRIYYKMYWDRLFLTAEIYWTHEKSCSGEKRLREILAHPVWDQVWQECRVRRLLNWKRRMKRICLKIYRIVA